MSNVERIVTIVIDCVILGAVIYWAYSLWHEGKEVAALLVLVIWQLDKIRMTIERKKS